MCRSLAGREHEQGDRAQHSRLIAIQSWHLIAIAGSQHPDPSILVATEQRRDQPTAPTAVSSSAQCLPASPSTRMATCLSHRVGAA